MKSATPGNKAPVMHTARPSSVTSRRSSGVGALALSAWAFASAAGAAFEARAQPFQPAAPAAQPAPDAHDVSKHSQLSQRFAIDGKIPEASVPSEEEKNEDPLEFGYFLQDLLERADAASKLHQLDVVVAYYRAVAKAVPDMAKGWSKLCAAYEDVHMRDKAIRACRYAIERPGVELGDFQRFVRLEIAKEGPLDKTESTEVAKVFGHLAEDPKMALPLQRLICDVGLHNGDVTALEECTAKLNELSPKDPTTVVYRWSLAMKKGEYRNAKRLIEEARQLPVPPEGVQRMEKVTADLLFAGWPKWVLPAALLAALAAIGWKVRRSRLLAH